MATGEVQRSHHGDAAPTCSRHVRRAGLPSHGSASDEVVDDPQGARVDLLSGRSDQRRTFRTAMTPTTPNDGRHDRNRAVGERTGMSQQEDDRDERLRRSAANVTIASAAAVGTQHAAGKYRFRRDRTGSATTVMIEEGGHLRDGVARKRGFGGTGPTGAEHRPNTG